MTKLKEKAQKYLYVRATYIPVYGSEIITIIADGYAWVAIINQDLPPIRLRLYPDDLLRFYIRLNDEVETGRVFINISGLLSSMNLIRKGGVYETIRQ